MPPVDSPAAAGSWVARDLQTRVRRVLDYHLAHRGPYLGRGGDAFHPDALDHPMAVALYASGLAHLYVATGEPRYADAARATAVRLIDLGNRQPEGGLAWGLGFPWRHFSADEPFAITTAIGTRALVDVHEAIGDPLALAAADRAARWLAKGLPWRVSSGAAAPWYSPSGPYVLPNIAAMVALALRRTRRASGSADLDEAAQQAIRFVLARQDAATGAWRYGYAGVRRRGRLRPPDTVDALHMTYTLEGLMSGLAAGAGADWRAAAQAGFRFMARELAEPSGRLRERVIIASRDDEDAASLIESGVVGERPADAESVLLVSPEESRVAAYGALIGALARAREAAVADETLLARLVNRVLVFHTTDVSGGFRYLPDDPRAFPRQEAHLFEGLAAYVRASTTRNG